MTTTYCEFIRQGLPTIESALVLEEKRKVVNRGTAGLQIPAGVICFYFYDETDGMRENISPMYYVGGEVFTLNGEQSVQIKGSGVKSIFRLKPEDVLVPA